MATTKARDDGHAPAVRGGGMARAFYRFAYRAGRPRWDAEGPHPALVSLVGARTPGRALDLGCGTGADASFLAAQGWQVVGVDFAPEAINEARARQRPGTPAPTYVVGDVTQLRSLGVEGPFELVIDVGCYHGIAAGRRDAHATEVAAVTCAGADLFIAGIAHPPATWRLLGARGLDPSDVIRRFGSHFDLVGQEEMQGVGRHARFVLLHLVRRADQDGGPDAGG
ncbi:MAG TPA: class I SAM-dependent methyltransferase [Acidimicrobiales bacterium]|nr:class I SAM-dependent methyltransferase [Acidimicrobiales bacterium]